MVVGANSPLGAACARWLEAAGDLVWRTHRRPVDEPGRWVPCDVTDPTSVDAAFAQIEDASGAPHVVVYCAGLAERNLVVRMSPEGFDHVLAVNLNGAFHVLARSSAAMARRRSGSIVVVSSVSGLWGTAGLSSYAAAKAGQVGLVRSLARELGSRGVRVNLVAAGLLENAVAHVWGAEAWREATPLGRFGRLDEVASVISFLASDEAQAVTGAVVPVDGGFAMGMT